jgi:multidrug resistance efflux pump
MSLLLHIAVSIDQPMASSKPLIEEKGDHSPHTPLHAGRQTSYYATKSRKQLRAFMKLTIRKTLLFSLGLFVLLAFAALAVTFFRINRTVIVDGAFRYRESYSVTVEEAGFVDQVLVETDSRVQRGDVLAVLTNRDLAREIAGMERRISMGVLELANMEDQEASLLFATAQDVLSLEESLNTKTFELEYRGDLHEMNEKLYRDGSITKERHDASRLAYRSIQGAVAELDILRSKKLRILEDLKVSPSPARAIKQKALEIDRDQLEYLKSRQERLTIRASESGVLLAEVWKALEASYLARGTHIADIVSFDDIDFVGYTKGFGHHPNQRGSGLLLRRGDIPPQGFCKRQSHQYRLQGGGRPGHL